MNAEEPRSFDVIVIRILDSAQDHLLLVLDHRPVVRRQRSICSDPRLQQSLRQIFRQDPFSSSKYNRTFNGVLELTHITRPVVCRPKGAGCCRDTLPLPTATLSTLT